MFYIRGGGDGHGVGMSQYGAEGYAQHGESYRFILDHYYEGTSIGTVDPYQTVRVLLSTGQASFAGATRAGPARLNPSTTYIVKPQANGRFKLAPVGPKQKKIKGSFAPPLTVIGPGLLALAGHGNYRGSLILSSDGNGGVQTVNAVSLDDYIEGVVPAEVPSNWAPQALEAQAVAARTYALTTSVGGNGYNLYDDTRSQMYGGANVETAASDAAVQATSGQVVTYNGLPVVTYFFSSSGGYTEDVQNVWPGVGPEPWLQGVPDPYDGTDGDPLHSWNRALTIAAATGKLRGLVKGALLGINVTKRGVSPRIVQAQVVGSRGSSTVSGTALAQDLGLPATVRDVHRDLDLGLGRPADRLGLPELRQAARSRSQALRTGERWQTVAAEPIGTSGNYVAPLTGGGSLPDQLRRSERARDHRLRDLPGRRSVTRMLSSVYAGSDARTAVGNRRTVRLVPVVLRAARVHHGHRRARSQRAARRH